MKITKLKRRISETLSRIIDNPALLYVCIATLAVIGFALITPPFQGPDEEAHFIRAQYVARGYLLPLDIAKHAEVNLPDSIEDTVEETFFENEIRGQTSKKYDFSNTLDNLGRGIESGGVYRPIMVPYSPVPYLPAVPGIAVGNLLGVSPLVSLYITRLSLGAASVLLFFFAIKLLPGKKYLLTVIGLLPMLLFQQSMVSVDGISYALLALFAAYVLWLHERSETKFTKREWVVLLGLSILLALSKTLIYIFLPLIFILWKKPGARKWLIATIVLAMLAALSWAYATRGLVTSPPGIDSGQQLSYILDHPLRPLRVAWNSYMTDYSDDEARGIVGVFGHADTAYPLWMTMIFIGILTLVTFIKLDASSTQLSRTWKLIIAGLCLVYFAGVNAAMYLTYTPLNFDIIYGVQGRYFLPIVILSGIILTAGGIAIGTRDRKRLIVSMATLLAVLVFLSVFIVLQRYYLYTP